VTILYFSCVLIDGQHMRLSFLLCESKILLCYSCCTLFSPSCPSILATPPFNSNSLLLTSCTSFFPDNSLNYSSLFNTTLLNYNFQESSSSVATTIVLAMTTFSFSSKISHLTRLLTPSSTTYSSAFTINTLPIIKSTPMVIDSD